MGLAQARPNDKILVISQYEYDILVSIQWVLYTCKGIEINKFTFVHIDKFPNFSLF